MKQVIQLGIFVVIMVLMSGVVVAATVEVGMQGNTFIEKVVTITVGDTVHWTNNEAADHTVTATNGAFDSGSDVSNPDSLLQQNEDFSHTFNEAGTFTYSCAVHGEGMSGVITVEEEQAEPEPEPVADEPPADEPQEDPPEDELEPRPEAAPPLPPVEGDAGGASAEDEASADAPGAKDEEGGLLEDLTAIFNRIKAIFTPGAAYESTFLDTTARKARAIIIVKSGSKKILAFKDNSQLRPNNDPIAMVKYVGLKNVDVCSKVPEGDDISCQDVTLEGKGGKRKKGGGKAPSQEQTVVRTKIDTDIWPELTRIIQLH